MDFINSLNEEDTHFFLSSFGAGNAIAKEMADDVEKHILKKDSPGEVAIAFLILAYAHLKAYESEEGIKDPGKCLCDLAGLVVDLHTPSINHEE